MWGFYYASSTAAWAAVIWWWLSICYGAVVKFSQSFACAFCVPIRAVVTRLGGEGTRFKMLCRCGELRPNLWFRALFLRAAGRRDCSLLTLWPFVSRWTCVPETWGLQGSRCRWLPISRGLHFFGFGISFYYFNSFLFSSASNTRICCMAISLSFASLSFCGIPALMNTAFMLSIFDRQMSSLMVA